jgi:PAS domain S-box-containing protein
MSRQAPRPPARERLSAVESLQPLSDARLTDEGASALLDAAPDGIVMVDEAGRILLVNRQIEELFGYDRGDLLGRSVDDLLPERLRQLHRADRTRYRVEPRTRSMGAGMTLFGRRADGSEFPVEISLSPMRTDSGLRVVAAVRDMTERTNLEAEARGVRETLDAIGDGVFIFDADTLHFTHVNQGAVKQVGYQRDELLGMTMLHIAPDFNKESLRALLAPLEAGEQSSTTFTTIHRHRDGTDLPVEITLEARRDDEGRPRTYIKIVRDISERLETDKRLRQAEQDLRIVEDRERIARDLHDRTIQRLFAAGLKLQGAQSRCDQEDIAARVGTVIDDLDDTIRELRSVIFGLHSHAEGSGLRSELLRVVSDERGALGFEPHVRFDGLIDAVSDAIATELLATLREALSNVARHARASSVEVVVECDDNVVLRVFDDGGGVRENAVSGNGTRNLTARAVMLGGVCRLEARADGGTMLEWLVPNTHEAIRPNS